MKNNNNITASEWDIIYSALNGECVRIAQEMDLERVLKKQRAGEEMTVAERSAWLRWRRLGDIQQKVYDEQKRAEDEGRW